MIKFEMPEGLSKTGLRKWNKNVHEMFDDDLITYRKMILMNHWDSPSIPSLKLDDFTEVQYYNSYVQKSWKWTFTQKMFEGVPYIQLKDLFENSPGLEIIFENIFNIFNQFELPDSLTQ